LGHYSLGPSLSPLDLEKVEAVVCPGVGNRPFQKKVGLWAHLQYSSESLGSQPGILCKRFYLSERTLRVLYKILDHLKLPSSPPDTAPAMPMPQEREMFGDGGPGNAGFEGIREQATGFAAARAPP